jgi:hypothetical protein
MQLLNLWVLNFFLTMLIVCVTVASLATFVLRIASSPRRSPGILFLAVLSFSVLGFVTGSLMGDSQTSVVGTVLPAVLTLLGGVAVYMIGSKGVEPQVVVSGLILCFALTLLAGSVFGLQLRVEFNAEVVAPWRLREMDIALEKNKLALEAQRLADYLSFQKLKRDLTDQQKVDLSKFSSSFERQETAAERKAD